MSVSAILNEHFPNVITRIICEYHIHHRKEWTKQLMKSVLYELKVIHKRNMPAKSSYNRIRTAITNATYVNIENSHHLTIVDKRVNKVRLKMLEELSYQYNSISYQRREQRYPNEGKYGTYNANGNYYYHRYSDITNFELKRRKFANLAGSKLGFSMHNNRQPIKYCKSCQQILSIKKFKPMKKNPLLMQSNMCVKCISFHRKSNRKSATKVRGFKSLPENIQNEIIEMRKNNTPIRQISIHFTEQANEYKLLKYHALLRLRKLGEFL
jgi:hypothetical protein